MTSGRRRNAVRALGLLSGLSLAGCGVDGCDERLESNLAGRELNLEMVIGGRMWHDLNGDGTRAADEPTLSGLTVSLSDGQVTATGADGRYAFIVKEPGSYQVDFDRPDGTRITAPDVGDDLDDSDADANGRVSVAVSFGERHMSIDAGVVDIVPGPSTPPSTETGPNPPSPPPPPSPPSTAGLPEPGPDPLCGLHEELVSVSATLLPVDNAGELQAWVEANLAFHGGAAELVDEPDATAFRDVLGYFEALRGFHEARGWNPQVDLADIALVPQYPPDAGSTVWAVLESRCGVIVGPDNPG